MGGNGFGGGCIASNTVLASMCAQMSKHSTFAYLFLACGAGWGEIKW